jgi:hypothetical protein
VFNFSVGMQANTSYTGTAFMGVEGSSYYDNRGTLDYHAVSNLTATVSYDFTVSGANIFGMGPIYFYNPLTLNQFQAASSGPNAPHTGHFAGSFTFDMLAGQNYGFMVAFGPNVNGQVSNVGLNGPIDGNYTGTFTFSFAAAPVPEPERASMLLAGLALLGGAARLRRHNRRFDLASAAS